jgi:hypothetical protein
VCLSRLPGARGVAIVLLALSLARCSSTQPGMAVSPSSRVQKTVKGPSRISVEIANAKLVLMYWAWLGWRLAVTIEDRGDNYVLIGRRLTKRHPESPRQWSRQMAKTAEFEHLLTRLDPRQLREEDLCKRPGRDGAFQMVRATSDGNTFIRSRDAHGSLELEECRAFDEAFQEVMRQAGVSCERERGCWLNAHGEVTPSDPSSFSR